MARRRIPRNRTAMPNYAGIVMHAISTLARSNRYGPDPIPIEEVLLEVERGADVVGKKMTRASKTRCLGIIEGTVRDKLCLKPDPTHVQLAIRGREITRNTRRLTRSQNYSCDASMFKAHMVQLGKEAGPTHRLTKQTLLSRLNEVEQTRPIVAQPLRSWSSVSTIDWNQERLDAEDVEAQLDFELDQQDNEPPVDNNDEHDGTSGFGFRELEDVGSTGSLTPRARSPEIQVGLRAEQAFKLASPHDIQSSPVRPRPLPLDLNATAAYPSPQSLARPTHFRARNPSITETPIPGPSRLRFIEYKGMEEDTNGEDDRSKTYHSGDFVTCPSSPLLSRTYSTTYTSKSTTTNQQPQIQYCHASTYTSTPPVPIPDPTSALEIEKLQTKLINAQTAESQLELQLKEVKDRLNTERLDNERLKREKEEVEEELKGCREMVGQLREQLEVHMSFARLVETGMGPLKGLPKI